MATAFTKRDYSLIGPEAARAAEKGLVSAKWHGCEVPRKELKELMKREDAPAIRDTLIWFAALAVSGAGGVYFWGSAWCVPFFFVYGVLYGSASNSRWHECSHGTAFKTRWLNDGVYYIACFMTLYEPTVRRWMHARHHTDTIIVGRDPEIVAPRPPSFLNLFLDLFALKAGFQLLRSLFRHAAGRLTEEEKGYIPAMEWNKVFVQARIFLALFVAVIATCVLTGSLLPAMLVGLPSLYGAWLSLVFGISQHVGLAEDVLDHRLNSRTIHMNPVFRFIYWNMNYHLEHHMYPMVPYHALPALHEAIKNQCPAPYPNLFAAYREIVPTVLRQRRDPGYFVRRELPSRTAAAVEPDGAALAT